MKNILCTLIFAFGLPVMAADSFEILKGFTRDGRGLHFQVESGGCTNKADFLIQVNSSLEIPAVSLTRLTPDHCMAFIPFGVDITYGYDELGLPSDKAVHILNSLE